MNCPICGMAMKTGWLRGVADRGVAWQPADAEFNFWNATPQKIEQAGGIVLDEFMPFWKEVVKRSVSFYCPACKMILTKL